MSLFRVEINQQTGERVEVAQKAYRNADGETLVLDVSLLVPDGYAEFTPGPPMPTVEQYRVAIQQYMDAAAQSAGYDDIASAVTYAEEPAVPKFQVEGQAFRAWRSLCWAYSYGLLAEVNAGARPIPAEADVLAGLPPMVWPI